MMANDRETKSDMVRPGSKEAQRGPLDVSPHSRVTSSEVGGTMSGNRDADLRPHGESGSSGVGLQTPGGTPGGGRIRTGEETGTTDGESGGNNR